MHSSHCITHGARTSSLQQARWRDREVVPFLNWDSGPVKRKRMDGEDVSGVTVSERASRAAIRRHRPHQKFPIFLNASETSDADVSDAFRRVQTCFQTFSDVADTSDFQSVGKHLNIPSSVLYPSVFAITVDLCIRKTSWQNLLPVIRSGRAGLGSAMSNMAASTQVLQWTTCTI